MAKALTTEGAEMMGPLASELSKRLVEIMLAMGWEYPDLVRVSGQTHSVVTQWMGRGNKPINSIGKMEAAELIERASGYSALWIAKGKGPKLTAHPVPYIEMNADHLLRGEMPKMLENSLKNTPPNIPWERLMHVKLDREFQTLIPDDAMAPEVPRGSRCVFRTDVDAAPTDYVICKDLDGNVYFREYRQQKPGRWEAHALNPAYLPLDSVQDELEVVAVYFGMLGRRAKV